MKVITAIVFGLGLLHQQVTALQVTPGSACSAKCLKDPESDAQNPSSSFTEVSEISCQNDEYESSLVGIKYKNCMECLQKSNATSQVESDTNWFLYNARYSVDVCIYGFRNETKRISTPCDINTSCKSLRASLLVGDLNPDRSPMEYCDANGGAFSGSSLDACIQCYSNTDATSYLANFLTALKAGCEQRPKNGSLLGLSATIFSSSLIEVTDPPEETLPPDDGDTSTGMTTGAIVGIAVGAGLLFLGGTGLFFVYHRKQKRLYANFRGQGYDDPRGGRGAGTGGGGRGGPGIKSVSPPLLAPGPRSMAPTPDLKTGSSSITQQHSVEDLSEYELRAQHGYTSNGQYYDLLEKEMQVRATSRTAAANTAPPSYQHYHHPQAPAFSVPAHPAYDPRTHGRQNLNNNNNNSREPSPQLPKPVKSNKPDSYALQAYLNAAEEAQSHIPAVPGSLGSSGNKKRSQTSPRQPPPSGGGAPAEMAKASTPGLFDEGNSPQNRNPFRIAMSEAFSSSSSAKYDDKNNNNSNNQTSANIITNPAIAKILGYHHNSSTPSSPPTTSLSPPPPIPPPPPGRPQPAAHVPSLTLPSIPRIRVPKKYSPPNITSLPSETASNSGVSIVTSTSRLASPTSQQGDLPIGIQIAAPLGEQHHQQHPNAAAAAAAAAGSASYNNYHNAGIIDQLRAPPGTSTASRSESAWTR